METSTAGEVLMADVFKSYISLYWLKLEVSFKIPSILYQFVLKGSSEAGNTENKRICETLFYWICLWEAICIKHF